MSETNMTTRDEDLEALRTMPLGALKRLCEMMGYRFEFSEDGSEERMIRPDGSVAVTARWTPLTNQ